MTPPHESHKWTRDPRTSQPMVWVREAQHRPAATTDKSRVQKSAEPARALARDGHDFSYHPISLLALGDHGWIQVASFLLCGAAGPWTNTRFVVG